HGFVKRQRHLHLWMAARGQVGPKKHFGSAVQRSDRAKMLHRQLLQADNKLCDVARGVGDVVKVPIEDCCTSFRENDLVYVIVAVAGARRSGSGGRDRKSTRLNS